MVKQIHAEWYKAVRRPYFRNLMLLSVLCGVAVAGLFRWLKTVSNAPEELNLPFTIFSLLYTMACGLYLVLLGADLAFSEQYKYNTLKNEVSYGLPRWGSYLSRWVVALAAMLLMLAALLGSYLLSASLLLGVPSDGALTRATFQTLGLYLLGSLPLWMGGLSVMLCLLFLIPNSTTATIVYLAVIAALPMVLDKLGQYVDPIFTRLYHLTLNYPFDLMNQSGMTMERAALCWAIGLGWTVASTAVGVLSFTRREIK